MQALPADNNNIQKAITILREGGVVAHATETCYGLACDMQNPDAVQKLFALKHRPKDMPVSALFESIEQAKQYLEWNDLAEDLAKKHLPGPLTIILNQRKDSPAELFPTFHFPLSTRQPIGCRLSPHPTALALVKAYGSPITTTSANLHGEENPYSIEQIAPGVDLILDEGILPKAPASTVVDCSNGTLKILRKGEIDFENS